MKCVVGSHGKGQKVRGSRQGRVLAHAIGLPRAMMIEILGLEKFLIKGMVSAEEFLNFQSFYLVFKKINLHLCRYFIFKKMAPKM